MIRPIKIDGFGSFRDQADRSILHRLHCRLDQFIHLDKPLFFDKGLHRRVTSLMGAHIMRVLFRTNEKTHLLQFFDNLLAASVPIHPLKTTAVFIDRRVVVQNIHFRQMMTLSDFKVIRIMTGGDLHHSGAEFSVHIFIRDNRYLPLCKGQPYKPSLIRTIAFVLRIHR